MKLRGYSMSSQFRDGQSTPRTFKQIDSIQGSYKLIKHISKVQRNPLLDISDLFIKIRLWGAPVPFIPSNNPNIIYFTSFSYLCFLQLTLKVILTSCLIQLILMVSTCNQFVIDKLIHLQNNGLDQHNGDIILFHMRLNEFRPGVNLIKLYKTQCNLQVQQLFSDSKTRLHFSRLGGKMRDPGNEVAKPQSQNWVPNTTPNLTRKLTI